MKNIWYKIKQELAERGLRCSSQALNALYYATILSSPEIVGCSDSLLLGLLKSGSYTIDALIDSGANTNYLKERAIDSANYGHDEEVNPVDMLFAERGTFGTFIKDLPLDTEFIETANILEIAISPESLDDYSFSNWFPKEQRKTPPPPTKILQEIENQVCYIIENCVEVISNRPSITLRLRQKPITQSEKRKITNELSDYMGIQEIEWAITLTNDWLTKRKLRFDNSELSLEIINQIYGDLRFGSTIFLESGGNYNTLSTSLNVAKRYAPERDQPIIGMIERDGRIYIKPYSYRNSAKFQEDSANNILSIGAEIPLPLTTIAILNEFEAIINSPKVSEETIQRFLEARPEIMQSLGYSNCKPHVILKQSGQKDLIPDFIMQRPGNNGFDILDLKLPTAKISVSNPYLRISYEITKAIAQLRAYRNFFKSPSNVSDFYKKYDLEPLAPELIVVIGRRSEFLSSTDRIEINKQATGLRIVSYDELIDYGRSRAINLQ